MRYWAFYSGAPAAILLFGAFYNLAHARVGFGLGCVAGAALLGAITVAFIKRDARTK